VLMPLIGIISGGVNLGGLKVQIGGTDLKPIYLAYGSFIQTTIDFLIIALVIFMMVRTMKKLQKPAEPTTKNCPFCTMQVALIATRCPHCTSQLQ